MKWKDYSKTSLNMTVLLILCQKVMIQIMKINY